MCWGHGIEAFYGWEVTAAYLLTNLNGLGLRNRAHSGGCLLVLHFDHLRKRREGSICLRIIFRFLINPYDGDGRDRPSASPSKSGASLC